MRSVSLMKWIVGAAVVAAGTAVWAQEVVQATVDPEVPAADATHVAVLAGENEVPPVTTTGTGMAWIAFDPATNLVAWTVEFEGLTGDATGAHFHGPAEPGANAGVAISLVAAGAPVSSPLQGTATLTAAQAAEFTAGQWYVNIHTAANAGGEIRGQVVAAEAAAADAGGAGDADAMAALMAAGQPLYDRNCGACHGNAGQGGNGVTLAGFSALADARAVIAQIVYGGTFMPAFPQLTRPEIAAIATYVRNAFGNSFGIVTEADVAPIK
ncbi:MAG: CHRD domain-containing protein [Bauldia sp.]|nr:CHRD domain-containing protein [Bauldia sp.]